jgi:hypothetical protein
MGKAKESQNEDRTIIGAGLVFGDLGNTDSFVEHGVFASPFLQPNLRQSLQGWCENRPSQGRS